MTDPNLPGDEGDEFKQADPDTSTNDQPEPEEEAKPAFPAAGPVPEPAEAPPEPVAAAPAAFVPPRAFTEHYWLLLGGALVMASGLAVWERVEIYGHEIFGTHSVKRSFLMGLGFYMVAVGIANIATGRLKGMGLSFITGVAALWLGIKGFLAFNDETLKFKGWSEVKKEVPTLQDTVNAYLGQWGPGVWLATVGGGIIILIFVKAIFFGGKKKEPAPAPAPRRRGRR